MNLLDADAIDAAALDSLRRHTGSRAEPHLVAAIFRDPTFRSAIINAIDARWRAVSVRTVFVHLTPKVTFSCAHGACELGDALVVYRERLGPGQTRRQAVLFQAKIYAGSVRGWVVTDPDQHALYRHWPPFKIAGGPVHEIRLPPGDYGRVLGLARATTATDIPRVSPRRLTQPGCSREDPCGSETMGTLGRAIRGLVRFEVGERVDGGWATAVADMVKRVGRASAGPTFPSGPRGGATSRRRQVTTPAGDGEDETADPVAQLDALMDGASDLPPESEVVFDDGDSPLSVLLIDSEERE